MNTAEYLTQLIDCKEDMKSAIIEKGVTPTGGLSTYADAIEKIYNKNAYFPVGTKFEGTSFSVINGVDEAQEMINLINPEEVDFSCLFQSCEFPYNNALYNIDTSKVTNMRGMFAGAFIDNVPQMDTSNVTDMSYMFYHIGVSTGGTSRGIYLPDLNCGNVMDVTNMFQDDGYYSPNIISIGRFIDLGKVEDLRGTYGWGFLKAVNLSRSDMVKIIYSLYDRKLAGYKTLKLSITTNTLNNLTSDDIEVAKNKGWELTTWTA